MGGVASSGCAFEYGSLDQLTCQEEAARDGDRVCRDGYWVIDAAIDMAAYVDDMAIADLGPGGVDLKTHDAALDSARDQGDVGDMTPCLIAAPQRCERLREALAGPVDCVPPLLQAYTLNDGCVIPAGTRCGCADTTRSCNRVDQEVYGACQTQCSPKSRDELCQAAQNPCGEVMVEDGCGARVTLTDCVTCGALESCEDNAVSALPAKACVAPPADPLAELPRPAGLNNDARFGASVDARGDLIVVGAPGAAVTNSRGDMVRCGAVYLYERSGSSWAGPARIVEDSSNVCNNNDEEYGFSVALGDGVLVVGAPGDGNAGRAFIYERDASRSWQLAAVAEGRNELFPAGNFSNLSGSRFGHSVAISETINSDGDYRVLFGAPRYDYALVENPNGGDPLFLSLSDVGAVVSVRRVKTLPNPGFYRTRMILPDLPNPNGELGTSVAFFSDTVFSAGAPGLGSSNISKHGGLYAWELVSDSWISLPGSPYTSLFFGDVERSDDYHGQSISYSNSLWSFVSAPGRDMARGGVYATRVNNMNMFNEFITPLNIAAGDRFGASTAAFDEAFIAGAPGRESASSNASDVGAAYLYKWDGSDWVLAFEASAPAPQTDAAVGFDVALSGNWAVIGAPGSDNAQGRVYVVERALIP